MSQPEGTARIRAVARAVLWSLFVGGLSAFLAGPIARRLLGPAVQKLVSGPSPSIWDPIVSGASLVAAGAAVILVLGRLVVLPPRLAAAGVATGVVWLGLLAFLSEGAEAFGPGSVLAKLLAAAAGAGAAFAIAAKVGRGPRPAPKADSTAGPPPAPGA